MMRRRPRRRDIGQCPDHRHRRDRGPFIFRRDLWRPGQIAVYVRNPDYKPRDEPASRLAGGKRALVDRIEMHAMSDHLQAINSLLAGEIDFTEAPPFDLHRLLERDLQSSSS